MTLHSNLLQSTFTVQFLSIWSLTKKINKFKNPKTLTYNDFKQKKLTFKTKRLIEKDYEHLLVVKVEVEHDLFEVEEIGLGEGEIYFLVV